MESDDISISQTVSSWLEETELEKLPKFSQCAEADNKPNSLTSSSNANRMELGLADDEFISLILVHNGI